MKHLYSLLFLCGGTALSVHAQSTVADVVGTTPVHCYYVVNNESMYGASWRALNADGSFTQEWDDAEAENFNVMRCGWVRNGMLCGFAKSYMGVGLSSAFGYVERSLYNGEVFSSKYVPYQDSVYRGTMEYATYSPADDTIYGFGVNPETYMMSFETAPGTGEMDRFKILYDLADPYEWCGAMCVNPADGNIYAISKGEDKSKLYCYTPLGESTVLATLDVRNDGDASGLAYFPETGYFLWNAVNADGSTLYAMDMEGHCTKLQTLPSNQYIAFFVTGDLKAMASNPATPEFVVSDFQGGALSGKVTFRLPSMTLSGDALSGQLSWVASLDGAEVAQGTGQAGSNVTFEVSVDKSGLYAVSLTASSDQGKSPASVQRIAIGNDTPKAPEEVTLVQDNGTLSATWNTVTGGVNDGYIDTDHMQYEVYLDGELVATTADTSWSGEADMSKPVAAHYVAVNALCSDLRSELGKSNAAVYGAPLELDVHLAPTADEAPIFTVIADDGAAWSYNDSYDPAAFSSGNHYDDAYLDTWLIMPAINFPDADRYYKLAYEAFIVSNYYTEEAYEVYMGKTPTYEGMTEMLQDVTTPLTVYPESEQMELEFAVPEAGVWYIGFHCLSAPKQWGVMLRNFDVSKTDKNVSAVANVTDSASNSVCYDLNGTRIDSPTKPGIYVERHGSAVRKVMIK